VNDERIKHWDGPGLDAWRPWSPHEVSEVLRGLDVPWCIVGGWAIELALGVPHRAHDDIEIAISRRDFPAIRDHLAEFHFYAVGDGEVRALAIGAVTPEDKHQNWVLDPRENVWRMDVMLEPGDAELWVFRRDHRISAPRARMIATRAGIPYLRPEAALLFKAKAAREKDETDLGACLPHLGPSAREWLVGALEVVHPDHPWIARLEEASR
jgi:hypothetical protein